MHTRAKSMVTPPIRPLHQPDSSTDMLCRDQYILRFCHPGGAYCQCVGSTAVPKGESGCAHDLQLWGIVRATKRHHPKILNLYANTLLLFDSACVASVVRLVKFVQKQPIVEGAVDVTWVYYSLNPIRYVMS